VSAETERLHVDVTGETVGEAKWLALRELEKLHPGLDRSTVRFEVVSEGERGLLGVGYAPARVVATVEAAPAAPQADVPVDEDETTARIREVLDRICSALGVRCRLSFADDGESLTVSLTGGDLGLVIGKHGQTIDAIQYLVNAIALRAGEERKPILVDAAGYRGRRQATLDSLAVRSAERALATGADVELEPMSAVERKLVHLRLQDMPGIETRSEGTEPNRYVVVSPARDSE
jgi:spoIIIJ-associated protein